MLSPWKKKKGKKRKINESLFRHLLSLPPLFLPDQDEGSALLPSETEGRNGWGEKGETECGIFPLQSQEGCISIVRESYRHNLSVDGNKFLRFSSSIVSYFPCRETGRGCFPLAVCGSLKWLLKFKIGTGQNGKAMTYAVSYNVTNIIYSFQ